LVNLFDISTFHFDYKLAVAQSKPALCLPNEWADWAANAGKTGSRGRDWSLLPQNRLRWGRDRGWHDS
jgi:hypothetical protein